MGSDYKKHLHARPREIFGSAQKARTLTESIPSRLLVLVDEDAEFLVKAQRENPIGCAGRHRKLSCLSRRTKTVALLSGELTLEDDDGLVGGVWERVLGHGGRLGLFGLGGKPRLFFLNQGQAQLLSLRGELGFECVNCGAAFAA